MAKRSTKNQTHFPEKLKKFGDRFTRIRKELDLSQEELGKLLGVGRHTVMNWERGNTGPSIDHLYAFERIVAERGNRADLGDLLGEQRIDSATTPLGFAISLLGILDRFGIRGVYEKRSEALDNFSFFVKREPQAICVTSSSFLGVRQGSTRISRALKARLEGDVDFRILLTLPAISHLRENQEERIPGSIESEITETVAKLLDWGVSKKSIRFVNAAPTVFLMFTSDRMLLNPYTYTTEAYNTFCLECAPTGSNNDIYSQYKESHFDTPWKSAKTVEDTKLSLP